MKSKIVGQVLWFNVAKGFGEILGEDRKTYFFTYKSIVSRLRFKNIEKGKIVNFIPSSHYHFGSYCADNVQSATKQKQKRLQLHLPGVQL